MGNFVDITGKKFGRLTAIRRSGRKKDKTLWEYKCECGTIKEYFMGAVNIGHTKSCGCLKSDLSKTHGLTRTGIYSSWKSMMGRCYSPKINGYVNYGGRGIKVCNRWHNVANFLEDMGERPKDMQIDRIDNDGNYEPINCRWVSRVDNARNKPNTKLNTEAVKVIKYAIKYLGYTYERLANLHGVSMATISNIKNGKGWSDVKI